jgi:ACS family glucarate transporter-like MFS transporter
VVAIWSVFMALTGAAWSYLSMMVFRFLFGAGEAGAFPGIARACYSWIPVRERGIANGINFSGSRIGAAAAMPLVAWMIASLRWRMTFEILAGVGFAFAMVWYLWFRNDPAEKSGISRQELDYILQNRQKSAPGQKEQISAAIVFGSKNMWLIMLQYFASNFTFYFCLVWAFSFIQEKFGLNLQKAGFLAALPFLGGAIGNWTAGWVVDCIYRRGQWTWSRRVPAMVGFILAAVGILGFVSMTHPTVAVLFLTLAIFGADMTISPSWSTCIDVGRKHAGAVSGTMNMAGNIGSFITALAFPYLKTWTGSSDPYFYVAAAFNLLGMGAWMLIRPDKTLEEY